MQFAARYLGNLKFSYDQVLSFTLRVGGDSARASVLDVIIEGGNNQRISLPIFAQGNAIPRTVNQEYNFRLNEHQNYEWTPNLSSLEFIKLLSNVTALKIRGTYTPLSNGLFLFPLLLFFYSYSDYCQMCVYQPPWNAF